MDLSENHPSENMDPIAFIAGIGIFCFLLLYIVFNLEKNHVYLKIFTVLFVCVFIALIPKVLIDEEDYCGFVVANTTIVANTTHFEYDRTCVPNTHKTTSLFFNAWSFYIGVILIYILIFLVWYLLNKYARKLPSEVQAWLRKKQNKP